MIDTILIVIALVVGGFLAYLVGAMVVSAMPNGNPEKPKGALAAIIVGAIIIFVLGGIIR